MTFDSPTSRLGSIDRLRGIVMVLMLLDHVREFFYLHLQVSDPMNLATTPPELFFTRLTSHVCAPVFVLLTGLGAALYGSGRSREDTAAYLAKRSLLLVVLELTVVGFGWSFSVSPPMIYLQVIWAIGLAMLALSVLLWLPRAMQIGLAALIIFGHNALDGVQFTRDAAGFIPWAILHDRSVIELGGGLAVRTSYPLLPWIGIILFGYLLGPLYAQTTAAATRKRRLFAMAWAALAGFVVLRLVNVYGDHVWQAGNTALASLMAFLNLTKYPPSLHFILLTLGLGLLALASLERTQGGKVLARIGRVPMFFYLAHIYLLHLLYLLFVELYGLNQGLRFGFSQVWMLWAMVLPVLAALYFPCRWFAQLKQQGRHPWLRYF
ncbi:MAG: heparan-alpha-glucosaminide N-acetyltransferase domain-containing protein [Azonexus sp.]|nr:heparan-alpha-glucosaminide N-acetyltransferase domain-containing protein [Azonexus sp.]